MKKCIWIVCAWLCVSVTQASVYGTPDQDPIVKDLRDRFLVAVQPDGAELLSHSYDCTEMLAARDDFRTMQVKNLTFSRFDRYLVLDNASTLLGGRFLIGNGQEWIGSGPIGGGATGTLAFRKDASGFLLMEWSYTPILASAELIPIAAALAGSRVATYGICTVSPSRL